MPTISLPSETTGSVVVANETEINFFGVDLLFSDDLKLTGSGDYATIEGLPALKQAILIRLITTPGEYALYPTFGCGLRQFVKKRAAQSDRDALRQLIIDQLSQEERIQSVEEVIVENVTSGTMTGVKISLRIIALGRENSFTTQAFAE